TSGMITAAVTAKATGSEIAPDTAPMVPGATTQPNWAEASTTVMPWPGVSVSREPTPTATGTMAAMPRPPSANAISAGTGCQATTDSAVPAKASSAPVCTTRTAPNRATSASPDSRPTAIEATNPAKAIEPVPTLPPVTSVMYTALQLCTAASAN